MQSIDIGKFKPLKNVDAYLPIFSLLNRVIRSYAPQYTNL